MAEDMSHGPSNSGFIVAGLLHRLNSAGTGSAWAEFIDRYSVLIMKTVTQFEYEQERGNECFLYVCEKLCEHNFRRLKKFNTSGTARFRNWLSTVVFNLCVDWHRKEFGRASVLPAISVLPSLDQSVFKYFYQLGMNQESCYQTIKADIPGLGRDQITASLDRIHRLLTPRQRWQLSVRDRRNRRSVSHTSVIDAGQVQDSGPGPEMSLQKDEELAALQAALSQLSTDERLLLHLRFQQGFTFKRIAQMEHLGDANRARRHVQSALDALFIQLKKIHFVRNR